MSLQEVHSKLNEIRNTSSTIAKTKLIKKFMNDKDSKLDQVVMAMYSDRFHYGVKILPAFQEKERRGFVKETLPTDNQLFAFLTQLAEQRGTSDADKKYLSSLCVDKETWEVVRMIVNKDAKAGFSGKTINKASPGFIWLEPYMRCSTDKKIENIVYPAIAQLKADGMFVNIYMDRGKIKFVTRNGKRIYQLEHLAKLLRTRVKDVNYRSMVLHGELLVKNGHGGVLSRKQGNGILNSCINGTADPAMASQVIVKLWDLIPMRDYLAHECGVPYVERWKNVKSLVQGIKNRKVTLVPTQLVKSKEEAMEFFRELRQRGEEGIILKNLKSIWKFHTSTQCIKVKNVSEAELRVIRPVHGKPRTKYAHGLGALLCESECGKLKVSVGGGFSDAQRKNWEFWLIQSGAVITVEFESIISDKRNKDLFSLFLPRFVELRTDRTYADTLEQIKKR